jgi:hypothetical protein
MTRHGRGFAPPGLDLVCHGHPRCELPFRARSPSAVSSAGPSVGYGAGAVSWPLIGGAPSGQLWLRSLLAWTP